MSLLSLWHSKPETFNAYAIRQIVAIAGDGKLRDSSLCSSELRDFLKEVDSDALAKFTDECLVDTFENSGLVLQDVVNEMGRRLEFLVENGLYRGKPGSVGFDGIWQGDGADLVVEVKTTDLYNVKLETVADYRKKLIAQGTVSPDSAVLFVVGRQDTGSLEAQIRGSRHAWTMRVIGADSLLRLLKLKEKSSSDQIVKRIQALLQPVEYTRLDGFVDLMFDATVDVESAEADELEEGDAGSVITSEGPKIQNPTSKGLLEAKRSEAIKALGDKLGCKLVRERRASYSSPNDTVRAVAVISKRYENKAEPYWYAYHPTQDQFLAEANSGYFVLGCVDLDRAYAIPLEKMRQYTLSLYQTTLEHRQYWHVKGRPIDGKYHLVLKGGDLVSLEEYAIDL
ncbi:hypothetical protein [Porphyrobacter sp. ULC335]|uniref:hypothetical protein n=1 Tax=Porphyrobacter sp. ULC335 TaxID=2854260 RepID=UPI00221F8154|nr:hypothetical protein [Porphyrobacter sp. ULC335]UYV16199.1 hypothetical protein KVF90_02335 [Porphyrobacter sp. ULC335]